MIVMDCVQGSEPWFQARCGIPTASNFSKIITTKGEPSKSQTDYINELAYESISGIPTIGHQTQAMLHGIETEAEARDLYQFMTDSEVVEVGMCYRDENRLFSCSPDGLVGEVGGLELKCPMGKTHVKYTLAGKLPTEYFQQVQGSLYITGREWWDFVSYARGMDLFVVRVERDEEFIKKLEIQLSKFTTELAVTIGKLKA